MLYLNLLGYLVTSVLMALKINCAFIRLKGGENVGCADTFKVMIGWTIGALLFAASALPAAVYGLHGMNIQLADMLITLLIVSVVDIKLRIVPNFIVICLAASQAVAAFTYAMTYISLLNAIITIVIFLLFMLISKLSKEQIGMGDVKLLAVVNLFYGLSFVIYSMLFGMIAVLIYSVPMMIAKKMNLKSQIPFVPFYTIGAALYVILIVF